MRHIFLFLIATSFVFSAKAQNVNDFVNVYLQNGYTIKGVLIENIQNSHIKIQLKNSEIVEFRVSEIKKIEINIKENNKLKEQKNLEAELKKQVEEIKKQQEKDSIQEAELKRQKKIQLEKQKKDKEIAASVRVAKAQIWEIDLGNITRKNYSSIGAGGCFQFLSDKTFSSILKSYSYITPLNNPIVFNGYEVFVDFNKNTSKSKNFVLALNYSHLGSSADYDNTFKMNFEFHGFTLNIGHYYYLNKSFQLAVGSGLSYTQNTASTNVEERGNVLCGRTNFYSIPIFVTLRYAPLLSKSPISFYVKSACIANYLPKVGVFDASSFFASAGISYVFKK